LKITFRKDLRKKHLFPTRFSFWSTTPRSKITSLRHEKDPIPFQRKLSSHKGPGPLLVKLLGSKGSTDRFLFIVSPLLTPPRIFACKAPLTPLFHTILLEQILKVLKIKEKSSVVYSKFLHVIYLHSIDFVKPSFSTNLCIYFGNIQLSQVN